MDSIAPPAPPALGVVRGRRLTNRAIAAELGCSADWASKVLLGKVPPPARFRSGLAAMVGCTEDVLFGQP